MTALFRAASSVALAIAVTTALFFMMHNLVTNRQDPFDQSGDRLVVDFVRLERDEEVQQKDRKPLKPPKPEAPPPQPQIMQMQSPKPRTDPMRMAEIPMNLDFDMGDGFGMNSADGDYFYITKVTPVYPRRALARGIEGYVIVQFDVSPTGAVTNARVIESEPPNVFDEAALNATLKFKYKPRIINGEAVKVTGIQNKFSFRIPD